MALRPAVVLVDMSMALSLQGIRTLVRKLPDARIVVLALPGGREAVLACVEAGVCGFVRRDASRSDLVRVIQGATQGELVCSATEAFWLAERVARLSSTRRKANPIANLTRREAQVLGLLEQQPLTNKEIARVLSIAESTVKNHVHNVLKKTGVPNREKAARSFCNIGARALAEADGTTGRVALDLDRPIQRE
jgi:DNA-binding NarL/FixJ family response regulator